MKVIKVEQLTRESFAPFGTYYDFDHPKGYALCGELHRFFPDRLVESFGGRLGFSPITVKRPEQWIVTEVEYHTTTPELILPLNDDMIVHVAPPSAGVPVTEETKAFLVPKHTMIKLNAAIWHLAPLPANSPELLAMIVLPECTYMNDIKVVKLSAEEQFRIEK